MQSPHTKHTIKTYLVKFFQSPLRLILSVLWCLAVGWIIQSGFGYIPHHLTNINSPSYPYPIGLVSFLLIIISVQAALAIILDYFIHSAWKLLLMLILNIGCLLIAMLMSMHAAPPLSVFSLWQFLCFIVILLLCLYHTAIFIYHKRQ